jgi:N6-adenosine-specific RNA methylase IME4
MEEHMIPFPNKKYKIIYADPPWDYNDKMIGHGGAASEYETQDIEWIKKLPVNEIADKDCVMFLWIVSPLLDKAFEVLSAWGFSYVTLAFCWVKETPLLGVTVSNLGRWTMGGVELCLLGRKGKPKRIKNNVKQVVFEIRTNHSKKPREVRRRIVELMGNITRIELFARQKTEGWDCWGNEVETTEVLEARGIV